MTRQQAIDEAVRRVVTPLRARWIIRDVDDAEIGFENFPVTIFEVRGEYQKIMSEAVARCPVEQCLWPQ